MTRPRRPGEPAPAHRRPAWHWAVAMALILLAAALIDGVLGYRRQRERQEAAIRVSNTVVENERAAVRMLVSIVAMQNALASSATLDSDGDGTGQFGTLSDLRAFALSLPEEAGNLQSPIVALEPVSDDALVWRRDGYLFRVHVPEEHDDARRDWPERFWSAYAWPVHHERTGVRTFFVDHRAVHLYAATTPVYSEFSPPGPFAAYLRGAASGMGGDLAVRDVGQDGHHWEQHFPHVR